ncbi:putative membrane protein C24H6.13 [Exophiala dermatitidis]
MSLNDTLSLGGNTTAASQKNGQSAGQFAASLVTAITVFAVEVGLFLLIKDRFARIYQPRTYLVPERERTKPIPPGWWAWVKPVLTTSNSEFVQRCGLDAYFFLRYLRTLLKIFVPAAMVILPILIPLNLVDGRGARWATGRHENATNVTGLDQLAWGNVAPNHTGRYWAHWLLALALIVWVCYLSFDELRNYIRMRQAYLTSPQHRLRASATTVLVSSIPRKWCTVEALDGLYDVFPGGVRNIWINRNLDELSDKIKKRDKLAAKLEAAETELIRKCFKKNEKNIAKAEKEAGKKLSKEEKKLRATIRDEAGDQAAHGHGVSTGNPHQVQHNIREALDGPAENDSSSTSSSDSEPEDQQRGKHILPIPILGDGISAVTHGLGKAGNRLWGGIRGVNEGVNHTIDRTGGFVPAAGAEAKDAGRNSGEQPETKEEPQPQEPSTPPRPTRQPTGKRKPSDKDAFARAQDGRRGHGGVTATADGNFDLGSPLSQSSTKGDEKTRPEKSLSTFQKLKKAIGLGSEEKKEPVDYPDAFEWNFEHDPDDAVWRRYLSDKDRVTMRLPIFGWQWMPSLPLLGEKVDTIRYCRKEVARLNVEIEDDQAHPERFPLMNSAFIQFNHQVAAHMACQTVSHHLPKQMAPRLVEIDPNDVIWDNMSIPWWSAYIRTFGVVVLVVGMILLWAIPVAFTSALSQLETAAKTWSWLHWVLDIPAWFRSVLQGVLPAALLGLLMFLLPLILRFLVRTQGTQSGMLVELSVQRYYFCFLFVQLFLVVSIASALTQFFALFTSVDGWTSVPTLLGTNIPKASNYFFSYMLLQAMSVSAGALVQVGSLIGWFILAPLLDSTARAKFKRQTELSNIKWGTFFPVYTNLACIGLIYSVISPLILLFNIVTFSLFWFVYRYNTLYVTRFTRDTGGLLYPNAINYTFVGVYVMEVALIGMFFLVRDDQGNVAGTGQAIGMIVILILTAGYQFLLNNAFSPLFRYLPITLEDDAVRRDEEFARAMQKKHGLIDNENEQEPLEDQLERNERRELEEDREAEEYELQRIERERKERQRQSHEPEQHLQLQNPEITMDLDKESKGIRMVKAAAAKTAGTTKNLVPRTLSRKEHRKSWADRDDARNQKAANFGAEYDETSENPGNQAAYSTEERGRGRSGATSHGGRYISPPRDVLNKLNNFNPLTGTEKDVEAQRAARNELADALFGGVHDELEDLTPEERDKLVQRAFQHSALRARRPVIWLPRDDMGVSDDEVHRMGRFSSHLWVSNVRQGLDSKGRCVYSGAPPDFSEVDLIQL